MLGGVELSHRLERKLWVEEITLISIHPLQRIGHQQRMGSNLECTNCYKGQDRWSRNSSGSLEQSCWNEELEKGVDRKLLPHYWSD